MQSSAGLEAVIETTVANREAGSTLSQEDLVRLFSVLSHDLKSPIFAIDGFSELLLADCADKLDEESQDFLRRIRSSAQAMKRVLDDMSHLVKLLARPDSRRPTPLNELFEEVLQKHNYAIEEGGVSFQVPPDLPVVDVDPEKMREALAALVSNALFFTDRPKGARTVTVEASHSAGAHRICIRDNGIGIDPRYASQVFDLGGVSKLEKSRGGGPGYGLYLAKQVIESQGGELSVESTPGEGSTFCFSIPG